jgi:hypothetical protein
MMAIRSYAFCGLLLCAMPQAWSQAPANAPDAEFRDHWGGFLISTAFRMDANRPEVILPPASLREGDQLWIRPQRLNSDEYLILQRCVDQGCTKSEVVRAWNAYGYMGPYPVLTRNVQVQSGGPYMMWMQHVPVLGTGSFHLYARDAPPLVFVPVGARADIDQAELKTALSQGPEAIKRAQTKGSKFEATFADGSTVQMQALRVPHP